MIFNLLYLLTYVGLSGREILLGVYMLRYSGATEMDLGLIFMIHPLTVATRPFFCSIADRYQKHKQLLASCLLVDGIMYLPFIIIPFIQQHNSSALIFKPENCFWLLAVCHLIGSVSFCGSKSLIDALTVNYAKRVGCQYSKFRLFAPLGYGGGTYILGYFNQGWILPDFTPTLIVLVTCAILASVLVHLWPDEHFVMMSGLDNEREIAHLPTCKQILAHMASKLYGTVFFCCPTPTATRKSSPSNSSSLPVIEADRNIGNNDFELVNQTREAPSKGLSKMPLTTGQQLSIFLLLLKRDFRIMLFLLVITFGGLVGHAPKSFVFTYMDIFCGGNKTCNGAHLAGLMTISHAALEIICYLGINTFRSRLNNILLLQVALVSLAIHYYFYGFLLNKLPPYFFLVEALHGLEFAFNVAPSVDLAHYFASEVVLLMPELMQRGIIDERNDRKLVEVSLMATMSSCFTFAYDGLGSFIGAYLCGLIVEKFSFTLLWITIATLSTVGFFVVSVVIIVGKCLHLKPHIENLRKNPQSAASR